MWSLTSFLVVIVLFTHITREFPVTHIESLWLVFFLMVTPLMFRTQADRLVDLASVQTSRHHFLPGTDRGGDASRHEFTGVFLLSFLTEI